MASGGGNDLAVIHFSGHGALVDGKLYLLPYEVDARDDAGIKANGLSVEELKDEAGRTRPARARAGAARRLPLRRDDDERQPARDGLDGAADRLSRRRMSRC